MSTFLSVSPRREPADGRRALFESVILFLLAIYLLVDSLNGFAMQILNLPSVISPLYKQGMLALFLVFAFQFEPRRFFWCLMCLSLVFVWATLRFFLVDNIWFLFSFQEAIKAIYLFVLVLVLSSFQSLNEKVLKTIMWFSLLTVLMNICFSMLGIGVSTYNNFGFKGFFYSGNAISGVVVLCAAWFLVRNFKVSIVKYAIWVAFLSAMALLIGTKGGFLGVVLCALLVMLFLIDARVLFYGLLLILFVSLGLWQFSEQVMQQPLFQRVLWFYENGGITQVLFSGRNEKLQISASLFYHGDIWQLLLGLDRYVLDRFGVNGVEFDWADLQMNFGIIFSMCIYLGHIFLFSRLVISPKSQVVVSAIIACIILYMVSSIAGHVMYNGMITPLWAVLIASALNPRFHTGNNQFPANEYKLFSKP